MKSTLIAPLLFASAVLASPVDKRDLVTKTETSIETVVVYTTVFDDEPTAAAETPTVPTPAAFFETNAKNQPNQQDQAPPPPPPAQYTPSPAPASEAPQVPSPPPAAPSLPQTSSQAAVPAPSSPPTYDPVPSAAPSAAPKPGSSDTKAILASAPTSGDVSLWQYVFMEHEGSCNIPHTSTDGFWVAAGKDIWDLGLPYGGSNANNNPLCRSKVRIFSAEGRSVECEILDLREDPTGYDLSIPAWEALYDKRYPMGDRLPATWEFV